MSSMSVESAVIPVAGAGSGVLPATSAIDKCMLPIYTGESARPAIDYMVEDCVLAGMKQIIFITSERGERQLRDFYEQLPATLEAQLKRAGKNEKLAEELERRRALDSVVRRYKVQPADEYGTAYPPLLAKEVLGNDESFALMGGDDFVYRQDGSSELADAIATLDVAGTDHIITGMPKPEEKGPRTKFGILHLDEHSNLSHFDEKPLLEDLPSNPVANIGRYILSPAIWPHIKAEMACNRPPGEEHYITYAINDALASGQTFGLRISRGKWLEAGSFEGLREAGNWIAEHPKNIQTING